MSNIQNNLFVNIIGAGLAGCEAALYLANHGFKVYLYDISAVEDKPNLAIILWDDGVEDKLNLYQEDRSKYYAEFRKTLSKTQAKKLDFLKIKADIIALNPQILEEDVDTKAKLIYKEQKEQNNATRNTGSNQGS